MSASGDLQVYIVEFLTARGWTVWRNNSGQIKTGAYMVRLSPENSGDIIGYDILGRYVHIEEKIGNDILSPGQVEEMAKVAESKHGIAGLITDKKQFEAWYDNIQKK